MSHFTKVVRQTFWQLIGKFSTSLATFLVLAIVSRFYGESGIGMFTLVLTYLSFFYIIVDFGFNALFLERLSGENGLVEWRNLFGLRIVWSLVLIIVCVVLSTLLPFSDETFVRATFYGSLAIFGVSVVNTCNALFQRHFAYKYSSYVSAVSSIAYVFAVLVVTKFIKGVELLIIAHTIGWVVAGFVALYYVQRFARSVSPNIDIKYILSNFRAVLPISGTLLFNVLYFRVDTFILGSVKSIEDVGVYNLAYSVFQAVLVLPTFIMNGFFPIMLDNLRDSWNIFKNQLYLAGCILGLISIAVTVIILIFSPIIIRTISGGGFEGSILSLRILATSFPAFFLSSLLMWTFVSLRQYKRMMCVYFIGLVFNTIFNIYAIPRYTYHGAAWVTVASEYLILTLLVFMIYPVLKRKVV